MQQTEQPTDHRARDPSCPFDRRQGVLVLEQRFVHVYHVRGSEHVSVFVDVKTSCIAHLLRERLIEMCIQSKAICMRLNPLGIQSRLLGTITTCPRTCFVCATSCRAHVCVCFYQTASKQKAKIQGTR
jgi:hypothetical protein